MFYHGKPTLVNWCTRIESVGPCGTWDWFLMSPCLSFKNCLRVPRKNRFPTRCQTTCIIRDICSCKWSFDNSSADKGWIAAKIWEDFFKTTSLRKYIQSIYTSWKPQQQQNHIHSILFFWVGPFWNVTCLKRTQCHKLLGSRWWLSQPTCSALALQCSLPDILFQGGSYPKIAATGYQ